MSHVFNSSDVLWGVRRWSRASPPPGCGRLGAAVAGGPDSSPGAEREPGMSQARGRSVHWSRGRVF